MDKKLLDFAFYLCTAVAGFFILGGSAVGSPTYVTLGAFNLIVAYFLGKRRQEKTES